MAAAQGVDYVIAARRSDDHITAAYCEEPGFLYPTVFVIRTIEGEPGILRVYNGDSGEAVLYHSCG